MNNCPERHTEMNIFKFLILPVLRNSFLIRNFIINSKWRIKTPNNEKTPFNGLLNINQMEADFSSKIIRSDKALFHLDVFVDRKYWLIFGLETSLVIVEKRMHIERVSGTFFFENESIQSLNVTVTRDRYHDMISQVFCGNWIILMG